MTYHLCLGKHQTIAERRPPAHPPRDLGSRNQAKPGRFVPNGMTDHFGPPAHALWWFGGRSQDSSIQIVPSSGEVKKLYTVHWEYWELDADDPWWFLMWSWAHGNLRENLALAHLAVDSKHDYWPLTLCLGPLKPCLVHMNTINTPLAWIYWRQVSSSTIICPKP